MKQLNFLDEEPQHSVPVRWKLYVDGASRKNPGAAGAGVYLLKNDELAFKKGFFLGQMTNNQAEYLALLLGVFYLKKHVSAGDNVKIFSDSELLIKQMKGEYKVRDVVLKKLSDAAKEMLQDIRCSFAHVARENNVEADHMANVGIDRKRHLTQEFLTQLHHYGVVF